MTDPPTDNESMDKDLTDFAQVDLRISKLEYRVQGIEDRSQAEHEFTKLYMDRLEQDIVDTRELIKSVKDDTQNGFVDVHRDINELSTTIRELYLKAPSWVRYLFDGIIAIAALMAGRFLHFF